MTDIVAGHSAPPTRGAGNTIWGLLKTDPLVQLVFLTLLLVGADRFAIRPGGFSLRVVFPVLLAACSFLYMRMGKTIAFDKPLTVFFMAWSLAGAASVIGSYDPVKSVGYTIWTLFNFFVIISLCYNFSRHYEPQHTLSLWFLIFRVHSILIVLDILFGIATHTLERPHLWFYESSYLAVFMTGYFGASLYMVLRQGRPFLLDFFLATGAMLAIASATGIFGLIFAILINFIVARQRVKLFVGTLLVGGAFAGLLYLFFKDTVYYNLVFGFLLNGSVDPLQLILARGGNRVVRVLVGWQAFLQHPWLGIGIGADETYMEGNPYPDSAWSYIHAWTDLDVGQPFCNVFVSVLGSTGILGFIPFMAIILYAGLAAVRELRRCAPPESVAILMGFFSTLLALQLDGTVQRYYLWTPLGLALGIVAYSRQKISFSERKLVR